MKMTDLPTSLLLHSVRRLVQTCLASFRFTEADAWSLLFACGLNAPEAHRSLNNRPIVQKKKNGGFGQKYHGQRMKCPSETIHLGIHPDFSGGSWAKASQNKVSRLDDPEANLFPR
jgi:hypothetical protein